MKCHDAEILIDKFSKNLLDNKQKALLKNHLAVCKSCSSSFKLAQSLLKAKNTEQPVRASEYFTSKVMGEIFRLKASEADESSRRKSSVMHTYRRLGFSLVLAAGVLVLSLIIPAFGGYSRGILPGNQVDAQNGNSSSYVRIFTGVDSGVKGVFRSINNSVVNFKGGTENEMQKSY